MTIKQISVAETIPIRHAVLRKNKPIETCYFTGDYLESTFHLGVFLDNNLAGICTLVNNEKVIGQKLYAYQLRGMAILDQFQGNKLGKSLMEFLPEFLKTNKILNIWCNARVSAVDFYQKFGFKAYGESFEIPYVGPHQLMLKSYE